MPRRPILPDSSTLRNLRADGRTYAEIATKYGVTVSAVYQRLRDIPGVVQDRPRYEDELPWRVALEHKDDPHAEALRGLARRDAGKALLPAKGRTLERWIAERVQDGQVVKYDRESGFRLVPRKKKDGDGYIRRPKDA